MIAQIFKVSCDNCGGEAICVTADMTGENEIIIDFLDDMELKCTTCGAVTGLAIDKRLEGAE